MLRRPDVVWKIVVGIELFKVVNFLMMPWSAGPMASTLGSMDVLDNAIIEPAHQLEMVTGGTGYEDKAEIVADRSCEDHRSSAALQPILLGH